MTKHSKARELGQGSHAMLTNNILPVHISLSDMTASKHSPASQLFASFFPFHTSSLPSLHLGSHTPPGSGWEQHITRHLSALYKQLPSLQKCTLQHIVLNKTSASGNIGTNRHFSKRQQFCVASAAAGHPETFQNSKLTKRKCSKDKFDSSIKSQAPGFVAGRAVRPRGNLYFEPLFPQFLLFPTPNDP